MGLEVRRIEFMEALEYCYFAHCESIMIREYGSNLGVKQAELFF